MCIVRESRRFVEEDTIYRKKLRISNDRSDFFEGLPDDIVISILCKLSFTATCPSDFITILITCKRLNRLGLNPLVLYKAGPKAFSIRAKNWSEYAHRFLRRCVRVGNIESCYTLGMIRFYCLQNRGSGASLMAKAAIKSHAPALYSLAVIQFNGSGGSNKDKDLLAGVALCARAASLGHVDAIRELGHCFQDGYGVSQNIAEGRRLLVQANAFELASVLRAATPSNSILKLLTLHPHHLTPQNMVQTGSGFGLPPANLFMREWFGSRGGCGSDQGLRLCSHDGCGRPETRRNEFRRCSDCGTVNYCSRGCQALDWKFRHKAECGLMNQWIDGEGDDVINDLTVEVVEGDGGAIE